MRKMLMLAGALSLLAAPAFATTPQDYHNQVQPGSSGTSTQGPTTQYRAPKQSAQVPTKGPDTKGVSPKYQPAPGATSHDTAKPASPTQ